MQIFQIMTEYLVIYQCLRNPIYGKHEKTSTLIVLVRDAQVTVLEGSLASNVHQNLSLGWAIRLLGVCFKNITVQVQNG